MNSLALRCGFRVVMLVLLAGAAVPAAAQQLTGGLEGTVVDSSGAVLPGAMIELTNIGTEATQTQTAREDGRYVFNAVAPGSYRVKISLDGFTSASTQVAIGVNQTARVDATLEVGSITETIEVMARSPTVDVIRTQVSTNVDSKVVTEVPAMNRDITLFVELMPGARQAVGTTAGGSQVIDISGNYAQGDGTRRSQSVFYLDGSENMGGWRNQAMQMPNPDTVQEIQVVASSASAEFGKQPGMSMNVITKSGTNSFKGTAFFATHWDALNANSWSANANNAPKPDDQQRWLGGTVGGPIKRNRTFFFASYQRFSDNNPGDQDSARMPTAEMMNGDFRAIPGFSIRLTNPATGSPIGNVIPTNLINPTSNQLMSRFPTIAAYSNDPTTGRFYWQFEREVHNNEYLFKIDHRLTDYHQLAVSYMTTHGDQIRPDNVSGLTNNVPGWGGDTETGARQHTFSARHTWQMQSSLMMENRFATSRLSSVRTRTMLGENLATLGGIWGPVSPGVEQTLPTLILSSGPTARGGQLSDLLQQNYRFLSTTSWVAGKHNVKFGAELQFNDYSRFINYDNGQVRFTGAYSNSDGPLNGPWPRLTNPSGDLVFAYAWADFLLGRVSSFNATGAVDNEFSGLAAFFFVQDQWQIAPRVTLTPGLRYELYGTQQSQALLAGYVDGHRSNQYSNAPVGLAFEGDTGIPDGMREPDYKNVAPRIGVAWDLRGDGKTVLRSGGGLYYAYPPLSIVEQLASTVGASTITGNNAGFVDPWGTARANSGDTACQFPGCTMPSFDPNPANRQFVPTNIMGYDPDLVTPRQWQFNTMLQQQLPWGVSLEGGYVGNRGRHGFSVRDRNLPVWAPNAGTGNVDARRPNQTWRGINLITTDMNERYDGMQLAATIRNSQMYGRVTYVLQRFLTSAPDQNLEVGINNSPNDWTANPRDIDGEVSSVVPRQQFRAVFSYTLPSLANRKLDAVLGSWIVSGNVFWYDGDRLDVTLGRENNFDGFTPDRPDQVGSIKYPREEDDSTVIWIDGSAFAAPPSPSADNPYPFGTVPKNAVRGPSRTFMDAAVMKTFLLGSRYSVQFRLDISNLLNRPNLSNPNLNFSSQTFGLIQTKTGEGRVMQMQMKFLF